MSRRQRAPSHTEMSEDSGDYNRQMYSYEIIGGGSGSSTSPEKLVKALAEMVAMQLDVLANSPSRQRTVIILEAEPVPEPRRWRETGRL